MMTTTTVPRAGMRPAPLAIESDRLASGRSSPVHARPSDELPFYAAQGDECALFERAARQQLPLLIKGPTGCGKTRFVEHMAARLERPLITVSCHDDLSAADLVGRHLIRDGDTARIAIESALTGHLVLSTLHTNDAPSAITRLTEMDIEPFLSSSAVDCVSIARTWSRSSECTNVSGPPSLATARSGALARSFFCEPKTV